MKDEREVKKKIDDAGPFSLVPKKNWLMQYFYGEKPLWKAFWFIQIGGGLIPAALSILAVLWHLRAPFRVKSEYFLLLIYSVNLSYLLFAWIAVWRCAPNSKYQLFSQLARILVISHAGYYLWKFFKIISVIKF